MRKLLLIFLLSVSTAYAQKVKTSAKESKAKIAIAMFKTGVSLKKTNVYVGTYAKLKFNHLKIEEIAIKQKYSGVEITSDGAGVVTAFIDSDEVPGLIRTLELVRDIKDSSPEGVFYEYHTRGGLDFTSGTINNRWVAVLEIDGVPHNFSDHIELISLIHGLTKSMSY